MKILDPKILNPQNPQILKIFYIKKELEPAITLELKKS